MPLRSPNTPRKPRILLVPPPELPVPAVQGGAVETLVTHLIRENKREGKLDLLCASIPDPEAAAQAVGKSHEGEQPYRHPVQVGEHLRKGNTQRHTAEHHRRHVSAQEAIQAAERFQIRSPLF